jgi:uncharacterized iron-regulated protein
MRTLIILLFVFTSITITAQDKMPYKIFDKSGAGSSYAEMLSTVSGSDIAFFGELHNNAVSHWLQLELTKDLFVLKEDKLILGAEMFDSDQQLLLDEYISGSIAKKNYEEQARLWPNHNTDYAPLLDFAAENKIAFIATNIPRRYASIVFKGGFEAINDLSDEAKVYIAPLPIAYDPEIPSYKAMLQMGGMSGHTSANLPKAQAVKDATMAHFIIKNFTYGNVFLHFNGAYHSDNYEGIVWYIKKSGADLNITTITTIEQKDINTLNEEIRGTADFIIVVDEDFTKTY